ncbi:MAG TPA: hypothetical protein DEA43_01525 [Candidatus Moranbacteria bacterium]|nr:hypothetical protein [Candidatus Moranbacteria bacterium]HBT45549.1 hypothetical protein [Candidatus Moranbacteria bacterium]
MIFLGVGRELLEEIGIDDNFSLLFLKAGIELDYFRLKKSTDFQNRDKVLRFISAVVHKDAPELVDPFVVVFFKKSLQVAGYLSKRARYVIDLCNDVDVVKKQLEKIGELDDESLRKLIRLMAIFSMNAANIERG